MEYDEGSFRYRVFLQPTAEPTEPLTEQERIREIRKKVETLLSYQWGDMQADFRYKRTPAYKSATMDDLPIRTIVVRECKQEEGRQIFVVEFWGCEDGQLAKEMLDVAMKDCNKVDETMAYEGNKVDETVGYEEISRFGLEFEQYIHLSNNHNSQDQLSNETCHAGLKITITSTMSEDSAIDDTQHPERTAIGLVFGNSYSSIAHTSQQDGSTTVIANEDGDRQIPSILSYVAGEEYQGTQAKAQIVRNPRNTIAYFRDFLGKGFKDVDPTPCHASAHPVDVDGSVAFVVQEKEDGEDGEEQEKSTLTVAEVTTRHLRKLKESASGYLGKDVNAAVITVPSDFSDAQKSALSEAASKAGIEVLQFIAEPIAALLAHDAKLQAAAESSSSPPDKIVLVADIGGTRSDIAVVASRGGIYTTLATAHDYELGGSQLDQILIEHAAKEFQKKNKKASDPRKNERSLAKLTLEAEAVKKSLSLGATASFSIESLADGIDFSLTVNRSRFELLANKVLMSFTRLIESAVQKAELDVLDIDEILLGGGSAHTPKIASNLQSHFPESAVVIAPATSATAINPSELTARGAAIQASLIAGFETSEIASSTEAVVTVTPHLRNAIGLVTGNDGFAVVVAAETPAPVRRTVHVEVKDGGNVLVRLAEGVREISVKTEEKAKTNGNAKKDDSDEDDSDDEPEETREKVWKAGKVLAEAGIRGVKKGGKVEIQVNVAADLSLTVVCREVGGKGGVRGTVPAGKTEQNGSAA
ncbi:Hsp70 protein that interacts with Zuo1p [Elasticomyces elasticus]|nr:Hsp70 protein that interacts with Zuo1p [Elasticomyces elasticus]